MNLAIEFRNCAINLGVFPEKAMTGESLTIETNFLNVVKKKKLQKNKKIYLYGAIFIKKKCLFGSIVCFCLIWYCL